MRTEKLVFLVFVCFGLLLGCNQFEMPDDDLANLDLKKVAKAAVFMVEPSGGDDTPAFIQAFEDAKNAGPGSIVQLCEGEFHLGFIEIRDFYGTLKGAGKGKTIITPISDLDMDPLLDRSLYPDLIKFVGGDVMISHLSMQTPPGRISVGGTETGHILSLLSFSANNADFEPLNENRSINVVVDNVCLIGQRLSEGGWKGPVYSYNCAYALRTAGDFRRWSGAPIPRQKVNMRITNSEFDTFAYGLVLEDIKKSKIVVGEKNRGNTFSNLDWAGGVWNGQENEVLTAGNTFNIPESSSGFIADDYPWYVYLKDEIPNKPSLFDFSNNIFNLSQANYGLYLMNRRTEINPGDIPVAFLVRNNQFNMTDGYGKAVGSFYSDGMVIRNNKFCGHGDTGLYLASYSKNGLVLGNNFSIAMFETTVAYLSEETSNWTFVGGNFKDKVINLGVNNVFTGMNVSTSDEPLGRSISEKIVPMNHLMK